MRRVRVHPSGVHLRPDSRRVLMRPFISADPERVDHVIARALELDEEQVGEELDRAWEHFGDRHHDIESVWQRHFGLVAHHLPDDPPPSDARCQLIGALFSHEYALESAALFNPSIVPHPDQADAPAGALRFIMSLRATGEGHISSIEFRTGTILRDHSVRIDPPTRFVTGPERSVNPAYRKVNFTRKMRALGIADACLDPVMARLGPTFRLRELEEAMHGSAPHPHPGTCDVGAILECVHWLAEANYDVHFNPRSPLCERAIFPVSSNESNGIEDARFVRFVDDDGSVTHYATYTAYNGRVILPQLLETPDFVDFSARGLDGRAVHNKGMALFPRRIDGRYAMLGRQDDEGLFLMFSDDVHVWEETVPLVTPRYPWELVKIGNCGSPVETPAGWLVLTHGVGPMRRYCIGALLLHRDDPSIVLGRLPRPLIEPESTAREGYVPNVAYSCGGLLHNGRLFIPYGMSDTNSTIVGVRVDELLTALLAAGAG